MTISLDFSANVCSVFIQSLQDRDSYWKMMQKYIGSDVTSMVTLPVIIFEPMTMLQKMAEVCFIYARDVKIKLVCSTHAF